MSWSVLSDETAKMKREKRRKRKIKRASKKGRYVVLGSRGRKGRKSPVRCVTCGRTLGSNLDGLVCHSCGKKTEGRIEKFMKANAPKPFKHHSPQMSHSMEIPEMTK